MSTQFNYQKHFYFKLFMQLYVTYVTLWSYMYMLSVNTVLMPKYSSILNISAKHKHAV